MILGYGFTFNNRHSSDFNVVARSDDRSLLPEQRRNEFAIPGRDGTLDYGNNAYEKRIITVNIAIVARGLEQLRQSARDVAAWLDGDGLLIFDDEPDKGYRAKVYSPLSLSLLISCGEATVLFECQPFAQSRHFSQFDCTISTIPHTSAITSNGTRPTPCIIMLRNVGSGNLSNIKLIKRAEV